MVVSEVKERVLVMGHGYFQDSPVCTYVLAKYSRLMTKINYADDTSGLFFSKASHLAPYVINDTRTHIPFPEDILVILPS